MERESLIYHIVASGDLKAHTHEGIYRPEGFEIDGFIHCTAGKAMTLSVMEDYFGATVENDIVLVLKIAVEKLTAEVKFEPPAPVAGTALGHTRETVLFPHVYGGLNLDAVIGVGQAVRKDGRFVWPADFRRLEDYF